MSIRNAIERFHRVRDGALDAWENRDAAIEEARRSWRELPSRWRSRDSTQTKTIVAVVVLVVGIIVLTLA